MNELLPDDDLLFDMPDVPEEEEVEEANEVEETPKEDVLEDIPDDIPDEIPDEEPQEEEPLEEPEEETEEETEEEVEEEPQEEEHEETEPQKAEFSEGEDKTLLAYNSDYTSEFVPLENIKVIKDPPFYQRTAENYRTPVVYKDKNGDYQLIAGGFIPVRVVEADDGIAQIYREDYRLKNLELSEEEKAKAISHEIDIYSSYNSTFDEAVEMVSNLNFMTPDEVKTTVLVERLTPELKERVGKSISYEQAELLLDLNKTQQKTVADVMQKLDLTVITTEEAKELKELAQKKELTEANARVTLDHESVFIKKAELNDIILRLTMNAVGEIEKRGAIKTE